MILLTLASLLLFFVTYFTGVAVTRVLNRFFNSSLAINFFETFIFGLIASFIYFNLLSFIVPVNYITLLPLLCVAAFTFSKNGVRDHFINGAKEAGRLYFSRKNLLFTIPFLGLLFFFWVIPPQNGDSGAYHYISIRWYEQYKIIPGLANVHGRLAFNPASFIISSAWSFTDLIKQPLYPLNGVLVLLFYTWLTKKILINSNSFFQIIILITAVLLFRLTLVNISSPSSDLLSGILLFYCGFRSYELIKANKNKTADYFPVLMFTCFAVTAKISAILLLPVLPFAYCILIGKDKPISLLLRLILPATLITVPWLVRNFILSGYLLYPIPGTNFFNADWCVPNNVIQLDYLYSRYGPRTITVDFLSMQRMTNAQLIRTWLQFIYKTHFFSLLIFIAAFLSPTVWLIIILIKKKIQGNVFILWCICYFAVWAWMLNSPEFRFGIAYLLLSMCIPLLELSESFPVKSSKYYPACPIVTIVCLFYYVATAIKMPVFYFPVKESWLYPLKDIRYFKHNDTATFNSVNLGNGVKLYLPDEEHECLNAPGPCMTWRYGEIEMRGTKIEDGFKNKKDEVKKYFPFVDGKE